MAFVVLYDACVLYPAPLRDLLVRLANTGIVRARWSEAKHDPKCAINRPKAWTRRSTTKNGELLPQS